MSATLDTDHVARYLDGCPILRSEGRQFELSIRHLPYSAKPLEAQLTDALELLVDEEPSGDVLAFLPGAAEIRRAMRESQAVARRAGLLVLPLHGDLPLAEQDRAIAPAQQRKVILATNVAESSVTVEGITAVIDSGLARIATYSQWTGLPTLHVGRVSKASAKQRAGRAGRTGPGRVLRLYSMEDYLRRPEHDAAGDRTQRAIAALPRTASDADRPSREYRLAGCAARSSRAKRRVAARPAGGHRSHGSPAGAVSAAPSAGAHSDRGHGARCGRGWLYCGCTAWVGCSRGEK